MSAETSAAGRLLYVDNIRTLLISLVIVTAFVDAFLTASLTSLNVSVSNLVQQSGLTVIDVAHHSYNWSTILQLIFVIFFRRPM